MKAFGMMAEDTGMDCPRLGHSAKAVVSQFCCCLGEVGGKYFIVILSLQETNRYSAKTTPAPPG